jgi:Flp pilus assembly protein protease CpaA
MIDLILPTIAVTTLLIGSYTDIKTREVPDWLNYSVMIAAIGIRLIFSLYNSDWSFIIEGALGFIIFIAIAYAMYYSGQWGGGDAKMLMALGAVIGFNYTTFPTSPLIIFFINLLIAGGLYGLFWIATLAIKNHKKVTINLQKQQYKPYKIAAFTLAGLIIASSFFITDTTLRLTTIAIGALIILFYYMFIITKAVEKIAFIKHIPPNKLTEGDWIAKNITVNNKHIPGPNDLGITKKQIAKLIKLKVKSVTIKEGIPFVPSFLLAYILLLTMGNWFVLLV